MNLISSYGSQQILRQDQLHPTLEKGLQNSHGRNQMLNHQMPDWNKLLLARPNSNKSKTTINCFCPVRIQHPLSSNPFLCCSDELVLATLFQKHPDAIQEVSCHMKFLIRVFIANWFEEWCNWNHSKECVILLAERFTSINVDGGSDMSPELLLLLPLRQWFAQGAIVSHALAFWTTLLMGIQRTTARHRPKRWIIKKKLLFLILYL